MLQALIELQKIDCQLQVLQRTKGDLPQRIEIMLQEIEAVQINIAQLRTLVEQQATFRRNADDDLAVLREKLKKYQSQLFQVKSNKCQV
jgi:predicted  nucleic acid-binding Zn-ribbon protein